MQSVSRWALRFCRNTRPHRFASVAPCWYPPSRARHDDRRDQVALDLAEKLQGHLPRFAAMDKDINDVHENNTTSADAISEDPWPTGRIRHASIIKNSSHRDGAMFKKNWGFWGMGCPINLADRTETVSKLKKFSEEPCFPDPENWKSLVTNGMVQIFSLTLAKTPINSDSVQLYGYLAVRDYMDGRLNYVFNRTRDKPVIVQKGSCIEMNGPSRGIVMLQEVLMEFDMRIKIGEKEEDDIELIDGLECLNECISTKPFTLRFSGSCGGAVDMCLALVYEGMEAIIEVVISEVQGVLDLSISSVVSIIEEQHKEIQLFHGAVCELCKKMFVVAVPVDTTMHMKFRVGTKGTDGNTEHLCSFDDQPGCVDRQIKLEAACISVKVTVVSAYI